MGHNKYISSGVLSAKSDENKKKKLENKNWMSEWRTIGNEKARNEKERNKSVTRCMR